MYLVCIRSIRIIYIGTVYKLEVIEINGARGALAHLCGMNEHESECHTGNYGIRYIAVQLRFAVPPAFPPDAGIFIGPFRLVTAEELWLECEVILTCTACTVLVISAKPKSGGCTVSAPKHTGSFRSIYPYTYSCRRARNAERSGCTYTCTFCYGAAVSEIIVEFQRMRAHANRFIVIYTYDFRRLNAAPAIVGCIQHSCVVAVFVFLVYRIVFLCGNDFCFTGNFVNNRYIFKVPYDCRELADNHTYCCTYIRVCVVNNAYGTVYCKTVICRICTVTVYRTHSVIGLSPCEIVKRAVYISAFVFSRHSEIGCYRETETHFVRFEGN